MISYRKIQGRLSQGSISQSIIIKHGWQQWHQKQSVRDFGVYPFNPDAIKIPSNSQPESECMDQSSLSNPVQAVLSSPPPVFTIDQEALFHRRYEENYIWYVWSWIFLMAGKVEMHHPDEFPLEEYLRIAASISELAIRILPYHPSWNTDRWWNRIFSISISMCLYSPHAHFQC